MEYIPGSIETKSADHNNKVGICSVHLLQFVNYSVQLQCGNEGTEIRVSGPVSLITEARERAHPASL